MQRAVNRRYGSSDSAEEFSRKAQMALYENTRAQFEDFAANGWANHKMTMYWMLNSQWPSFFGHLFDYYLKPGGAYYGAKKGLRPLSVTFDYYATGDHSQAKITLVNQTPDEQKNLRVRTRIYDLNGNVKYDKQAEGLSIEGRGAQHVLVLPRLKDLTPTYFVRCELFDSTGKRVVDNVYWQSTTDDDVGPPANDSAFDLKQASWADLTALNTMAKVPLDLNGASRAVPDGADVHITLHNPTSNIAFFERVEVTSAKNGSEILPITYDDNYITVFPGETLTLSAHLAKAEAHAGPLWLRLAGENTAEQWAEVQ